MSKIILLLFCVSLSFSTVFATNGDSFTNNNIEFTITSESDLTVKITDGSGASGNLTIDTVIYNNVTYTVSSIGFKAFDNSTSLTSLTLTNAVSIANKAFSNCSGLTSISLPSVTSIGNNAFYSCTSLTSLSLTNECSIGDNAFSYCTSLTSISLPNQTSIGDNVFSYCTSLTSISLPNVTTLGNETFYGCTSLTSISLPNTTSIGDNAFDSCTSLTSISLPKVTSIGDDAFYSCTSLTSISLPKLTSVGDNAFSSCTSLTSISLPDATSIGKNVFLQCDKLNSISLPSVTSIDAYAFINCSVLDSIIIAQQTIPDISTNTFMSIYSTPVLYVPKSAVGTYQASSDITEYLSVEPILDTNEDTIYIDSENKTDSVILSAITQESWLSTSNADWLSIDKETGIGKDTIAISISDEGNTYRIDSVLFSISGYDSTYVIVKQFGIPQITWGNLATITYGTSLTDAVAKINNDTISGTFTYSQAIGTILTPGEDQELTLIFTPDDLDKYKTVYDTTYITVTKAELTVTGATASDKEYDGTTNASISDAILNGVIIGDDVALETTGSFATKDVATGIYVSLTLSGNDTSYYSLTQPSDLVASITAKELTVTGASVSNKEYDGTTDASISGATLSGVIDGDDVALETTGSFATKNVATDISVSLTLSGNDTGNYSLTQPELTASITKAALSISVKDETRTYGEENPTFTLVYDGFVKNENESVLDQTPTAYCTATTESVPGTYDILISGVTDDNYTISYTKGTLTITAASTTAIEEKDLGTLSLYPNPVSNSFQISGFEGTATIYIYNLSGQLVLRNSICEEESVNITDFSKGYYIVKIKSNDNVTNKKILKVE